MSALTDRYLDIGQRTLEMQTRKVASSNGGHGDRPAPGTGPDAREVCRTHQRIVAIDSEIKVLKSAEFLFVCHNVKPPTLAPNAPMTDDYLEQSAENAKQRS